MAGIRIPEGALVMVGDGARALFFRNKGTPLHPDLSVENVFEQDNPLTHELGTERPTRGADFSGGWATNGGSPRSNIEQTDWHQLNEDRFAKDIADKLYQLAHANRFYRLVIVAPPRVLGTLRKALHKEVLERVETEVPKDFAHMPTATIQHELTRGYSP
jgi:protein required for attachment to host cells